MGTAENSSNLRDTTHNLPEKLLIDDFVRGNVKDPQTLRELEISPTIHQLLQSPRRAVIKPVSPSKGHFRLLQLWEGRIIEVRGKEFTSIISDRTNPDFPDEEVTLDLEEVPIDDLPLIKPGAVFYWSVGYADHPGRPRVRESRIRLRRLPKWTQAELDRAKEKAEQLSTFLTGS